ncbi:MAG: S-layer homology domain-containing protein [Selenomonas sp.]|jgi:hypothetical protein|nr:S-layer homology domain-containing protein [Selenomonas sp.]MDD6120045.1 S-layer homology domain-containing protein [Selenomonadaceae bacterium]MDY3915629.1 S-layer homology domain-containing protein [Selenomonadaceae bacterium]
MKKKALVAAVLAATTLTATPAFAAQNPFKDMPQGHWAYDAVNMLVKDGVIDGYGDGTFGGDKLMNRYEMAEIVANAAKKYGNVSMKDKGAIKKLEREFKAELKDMDARLAGVEQDVAQLKKGQSSFKWFGDARIRYIANKKNEYYKDMGKYKGKFDGTSEKSYTTGDPHMVDSRVRLGLYGEPAQNVSVMGRFKLENATDKNDAWSHNSTESNNNSTLHLDQMEFNWHAKNNWQIDAGRMQKTFGQGLIWWENPIDGFAVHKYFGGKAAIQAGWGDLSAENWGVGTDYSIPAFFADGNLKLSDATTLTATYLKAHSNAVLSTVSIDEWGWGHYWDKKKSQRYELGQAAIGLRANITHKWHTTMEAIHNNVNGSGRVNKDGFWGRLIYGHQDWNKGGTWELYGEYAALGNYAVDSTGWGHHLNFAGGNGYGSDNGGARGWGAGFTYMLAPRTNLDLAYYKMKPYDTSFGEYRNMGYAAFCYSF